MAKFCGISHKNYEFGRKPCILWSISRVCNFEVVWALGMIWQALCECYLQMLLRRILHLCDFCQFLRALPVLWLLCFNAFCCEPTTIEPSLQLCPNVSLDCELLEPGQYPFTVIVYIAILSVRWHICYI